MVDDYEGLTIAFPDTLITSAPLGIMVESVFNWRDQGDDFASIQDKLAIQISRTSAFIMVDDLDHLVKVDAFQMGLPFWAICLALSQSFILTIKV